MTTKLGWLALFIYLFPFVNAVASEIKRVPFQNSKKDRYLIVEVLSDEVFHLVLGAGRELPSLDAPLATSPYIAKKEDGKTFEKDFSGPSPETFRVEAQVVQTSALSMNIDTESLCLSFFDVKNKRLLTHTCPLHLNKTWKGLAFTKEDTRRFYGLGEQYLPDRFGSANGDWNDKIRYAGSEDDATGTAYPEGNAMVSYMGGAVGNTQYPILYAKGKSNYSLFLDTPLKQRWDFTNDPAVVETNANEIPFFFTLKESLLDLRIAYMDLVGHPLVPPKKAFGLWVSEYGFLNWQEIRDRLYTLREQHFPIDGFMLDLQWFGNVTADSETSNMGNLAFDETHFPNPKATLSDFWKHDGIGFITIEEPYISKNTDAYRALAPKGFLVKNDFGEKKTPQENENNAFYIDENPWWGLGGMIDYLMEEAGEFWHKWKRMPLILAGVIGHWTDLSEPEMYRTKRNLDLRPVYGSPKKRQFTQAEAQNIFALSWAKSIYKGYQDFKLQQRPFSLSRSGGSGIQRYGAAKWCGDIGSNFGSLAQLYGVQLHLMFSGVDYYGGDIGGFHRTALGANENIDELYTQWFADATSFDVPVRPHTLNLDKTHKTSPAEIGDRPSNLHNIRQRYTLSPYYYSLAHRAYLYGEPMIPAVVMQYPDAPVDRDYWDVEQMGHEKLVGRDLLVGLVAASGEKARNLYLPPGEWVDYHSNEWHASTGSTIENYSEKPNGVFQLPVFARAGAILPKMFVDDQTLNILGKRVDKVTHTELIARVYPSSTPSSFTLYEDDGLTVAYRNGEVSKTTLHQAQKQNQVAVTVDPAEGSFEFEDPNTGERRQVPSQRDTIIELVTRGPRKLENVKVLLGTQSLTAFGNKADWIKASEGFYLEENNTVVIAKSGLRDRKDAKAFTFQME